MVGHFTDPAGAPVSLVQVRLHTGRCAAAIPRCESGVSCVHFVLQYVQSSKFCVLSFHLSNNIFPLRRHQIRAHLRYEGHPLIGAWTELISTYFRLKSERFCNWSGVCGNGFLGFSTYYICVLHMFVFAGVEIYYKYNIFPVRGNRATDWLIK